MSLGNALNASVSGLQGQSAALSAVSENIANASTTAYKKREISFESLVISSSVASSLNDSGGGVLFDTSQNMQEQGLIQNTGQATNIAINGQGFFVATENPTDLPAEFKYTRNGDYSTDENGLLINNEGLILLGQRTDDQGNVTAANNNDLNSLVPVDLNTISGTAQRTTSVEMDMNLPADSNPLYTGSTGDPTFVTAIEIFDDLGVSHTIEQTWYQTDANEWVVEYADPYQTTLGASSPATGELTVDAQRVQFNGDGSIDTIEPGSFASGSATFTSSGSPAGASPFPITFSGPAAGPADQITTGANPLTFNLDFGSQNLFDGLTQFSSNDANPSIEISNIDQDGVRFGQLSGVEIDDTGLVTALFDNGVRRPIFQIPIATFPNPEGLTNVRGTVYDENERAGNFNLRLPGEGNSGDIEPTSLELSTVDTSDEFNKMIVAQQNYSSAAQVLSTVDEMFDSLLAAVR